MALSMTPDQQRFLLLMKRFDLLDRDELTKTDIAEMNSASPDKAQCSSDFDLPMFETAKDIKIFIEGILSDDEPSKYSRLLDYFSESRLNKIREAILIQRDDPRSKAEKLAVVERGIKASDASSYRNEMVPPLKLGKASFDNGRVFDANRAEEDLILMTPRA